MPTMSSPSDPYWAPCSSITTTLMLGTTAPQNAVRAAPNPPSHLISSQDKSIYKKEQQTNSNISDPNLA